jgi:2-C-methyl-D-erythritol 4-phosphate cytidylyltransferase
MKAVAIIPAAGLGTRMKSASPKQFLALEGSPIILHTLRKFARCPLIKEIIVPLRKTDVGHFRSLIEQEGLSGMVRTVSGGIHRQDSVFNSFKEIKDESAIVVVHDAVRPFVEVSLIETVIREADDKGAAILAIPATDTVKQIDRHKVVATLPRDKIVLVQTPQAFRHSLLKEAFEKAVAEHFYATDESCLVERLGYEVVVLRGTEQNIKITKPADLPLAELLIRRERAGSSQDLN